MDISVYITSFNKEQYINQSIESVLNQSLQPKTIIIVDDASSDKSRDIIIGYKNRYPDKIITIFNEQNLGISKARNIALKHCGGDIITFLDGDDLFYKDKLLMEYEILLSQNKISVVYSNFNYISPIGKKDSLFSKDSDQPVTGNIFKDTFLRQYNVSSGNNYIYEMYYKNCAANIGLYDENIKLWEDWDFRIRMSKKYRFEYCSNVNSGYRKLDKGLHNSNPILHYREQIKIYKKNKHLLMDLRKEDKNLIINRLYSNLKWIFIRLSKKNLKEKNIFRFLLDTFEFLWTFKMKKAMRFIVSEL